MSDAQTPPPDPSRARDDALAVVRRLREAGHVAYFAGGCVRDALLGLAPKDYDVATDAPPDRVRALFRRTQAVGAAFGVILVRQGRSQVEVATFRSDGKYVDGRRPEGVVFTTAEEDAKRRDFTINGMFFDPVEEKVIDYVGGQEDARERVLRAIGEPDRRFEEDHLRLLRAVRFATRFRLKIDPATEAAIARHASHLTRISPERIAEELRAMLTASTRAGAWFWLDKLDLNPVIFRFLKLPWDLPEKARKTAGHYPDFYSFLTQEHMPFGMALAAAAIDYVHRRVAYAGDPRPLQIADLLVRPIVLQMVKAVRQALRISNEEADAMQGTLEGLGMILLPRDELPNVATLKRFLARPTAPLSRGLLDALAHRFPGQEVDWPPRWQTLRDRLAELERSDFAPLPFITGDDLSAAGLKPGPAFKRALDAAYDAQLEGRVTTKDEALALGLTIAREQG